MLRILKETPITIEGKDCLEQLVWDDAIWAEDACDYCCFREWNDWSGEALPCNVVHGCGTGPTYFVIKH